MSLLLLSLSLSIVSLPILFSQLRRKRKRKRKRQRFLRLSFTFPSAMLDFRRKIIFSSSRYACTHLRTFLGKNTEEENEMGGENRRGAYFSFESHSGGGKGQKKRKACKPCRRFLFLSAAQPTDQGEESVVLVVVVVVGPFFSLPCTAFGM